MVAHARDGVDQHAGVGVARLREQAPGGCHLDQAAQVHHPHLVAHMAHHGQVVRDEQIGQPTGALQVAHEVEHLGLHAHIQRRGGLVTDQKFGRGGQGTGNRDALALPTRELVRVLAQIGRAQTHRLQQAHHRILRSGAAGGETVLKQRLSDHIAHRPARVEAGIGVLKNHLDAPAQSQGVAPGKRGVRVLAVKLHLAPAGLVQTHQQTRHRAFAAARLAHQGHGFAAWDGKVNPIDRVQPLTRLALEHAVEPWRRHVKVARQVAHLYQGRRGLRPRSVGAVVRLAGEMGGAGDRRDPHRRRGRGRWAWPRAWVGGLAGQARPR